MFYDQTFRAGYPTSGKYIATGPEAWRPGERTCQRSLIMGCPWEMCRHRLGSERGPGTRWGQGRCERCPSSSNPVMLWSFTSQTWGTCVWSNYMYMGGLSKASQSNLSVAFWGVISPAVRQSEEDAWTHVLAADETFNSVAWNFRPFNGGLVYRVNHQDNYFATPRPTYENVLYGDGHVSALTKDDFPQGLLGIGATNWSVSTSLTGPLFYWNPNGSRAFPP